MLLTYLYVPKFIRYKISNWFIGIQCYLINIVLQMVLTDPNNKGEIGYLYVYKIKASTRFMMETPNERQRNSWQMLIGRFVVFPYTQNMMHNLHTYLQHNTRKLAVCLELTLCTMKSDFCFLTFNALYILLWG